MLRELAHRLFAGEARNHAGDRLEADGLRPGAIYEYRKEANMVECARVVAVEDDASGVPHIRFEVTLSCRGRIFDYGPRTMGAHTFLSRYRIISA